MQLPENNARDLSASREALNYFEEYAEKFPEGTWLAEIKKNQQLTYEKLAAKEMYIADYYYKTRSILKCNG